MSTLIAVRSFLTRTGVVLGLVLLVGGLARGQDERGFPGASPESQGIPAAALRRLAAEVDRYVKAGTVVGAELLVIKNRKTVLHQAFGYRDRDEKLPMKRDTVFNVCSMTKPITGVAVQILVDEGKIRLEDPVAKYLTGFDNDKSRNITIKQLLQHRSGLPLTILKNLDKYPNLQAQAAAVGTGGPQFKPDTKFWYSDAGSDAAGKVVSMTLYQGGMTFELPRDTSSKK
jgi:CubicO group peptidase (beta-lactamase class C family)